MLDILRSKTDAEALMIVKQIKDYYANLSSRDDAQNSSFGEVVDGNHNDFPDQRPHQAVGLEDNSTLEGELMVGSPAIYRHSRTFPSSFTAPMSLWQPKSKINVEYVSCAGIFRDSSVFSKCDCSLPALL